MDIKTKGNKQYSGKIPDVFIFKNGPTKDKQKKLKQKPTFEKQKEKADEKAVEKIQKDEKAEKGPSKRPSKNPFLPIHDWIKLSKEMEERISSARQGFEIERLSKLSFEANSNMMNKEDKKKQKIKYEDCLTLTTFRRKQENSCVKKILHVPTLTVYYLRESVINPLIGKHDLQEWINNCNEQVSRGSSSSQSIIQLYWNTPEGYYSILYEYVDGTFFQTTLDNLYSFPLPFIQSLAQVHLIEDLQIFNSELIIQRNNSQLAYLPIYEETGDLTNNYRNFSQVLDLNGQCKGIEMMQKKLAARLGFLVALTYFGQGIIDEDIANIFFKSQNDCCLVHKLLNNPSSLLSIYVDANFENNQRQKEFLIDFLCKTLKFNPKKRSSFSQIKKHKFLALKNPENELYSMNDLTTILQSGGESTSSRNSPSRELSLHKMNKILSNMKLILQGVRQDLQVNLSPANKNIEYLVRDIGLAVSQGDVQVAKVELVKKLKKIYNEILVFT